MFDLMIMELISYHQNDKGLAIKKVLKHLNIPAEQAMSFGDDHGDIPMFFKHWVFQSRWATETQSQGIGDILHF